jgi:toxin-antitoxin system PIN domain toxin
MLDVNVLAYAFRSDTPQNPVGRAIVDGLLSSPAPFAVSERILSGFVRLVTHPKVYRPPTPIRPALEFATKLRSAPNCVIVRPGERYWRILVDLCLTIRATGNDVPDACHAALAIESNCEWLSAGKGFARFPGLRWRNILDPNFKL